MNHITITLFSLFKSHSTVKKINKPIDNFKYVAKPEILINTNPTALDKRKRAGSFHSSQ